MYNGGKNGSGTYQQIINYIPPHSVYFELFAGSAAIYFNKLPAGISILMDMDPNQVEYLKNKIGALDSVHCGNALEYLKFLDPILRFLDAAGLTSFIYLDPPYLLNTRSCKKKMYDFELTWNQHAELLLTIVNFKTMVMISAYENDLYDFLLNNWTKHSFKSMSRKGIRNETIYFNYAVPDLLHDYRYLGNNFRDRALKKLSRDNVVSKISKLPIQDRNALLLDLSKHFNLYP